MASWLIKCARLVLARRKEFWWRLNLEILKKVTGSNCHDIITTTHKSQQVDWISSEWCMDMGEQNEIHILIERMSWPAGKFLWTFRVFFQHITRERRGSSDLPIHAFLNINRWQQKWLFWEIRMRRVKFWGEGFGSYVGWRITIWMKGCSCVLFKKGYACF